MFSFSSSDTCTSTSHLYLEEFLRTEFFRLITYSGHIQIIFIFIYELVLHVGL